MKQNSDPLVAAKEHLKSDYINIMKIGSGSYATVFKARNKKNELVAVKQINMMEVDSCVIPYLWQEVEVMSMSKNANIVKFYESFEQDNYLYIIMEYCTTDLETILRDFFNYKLQEPYVITIMKQLLNAFAYLHSMNIIHRDIKTENILVTMTNEQLNQLRKGNHDIMHKIQYKICDMGLAKQLGSKQDLTRTYAGSPLCMGIHSIIYILLLAPEVIKGENYGLLADLYSLGVIAYQAAFGDFPYCGNSDEERLELIRQGQLDFNFNGCKVSPEFENLITQMLVYDPEDRITWEQLYEHPFFNVAPLEQINTQDLAHRRNKTVYKNKGQPKNIPPPINQQELTEQQKQPELEQNQPIEQGFPNQQPNIIQPPPEQILILSLQQTSTRSEQQNFNQGYSHQLSVIPQPEAMEEDDDEVIDMQNPNEVFINRIVTCRNNYILILRAASQLKRLNELFGSQLNSTFFSSVASQLHIKLKEQMEQNKNFLSINPQAWLALQKENQYQELVKIVIEDSDLFTQKSNQEQKQKGIFGQFMSYLTFTKSSEGPSIEAKGFIKQYNECVRAQFDVLRKKQQTDDVLLGMICILKIWNWGDHSNNHDVHQADSELRSGDLKAIVERLMTKLKLKA